MENLERRKYQKEGTKFCVEGLKTQKSVYLADDTGLGKTVQSLDVIQKIASKGDIFKIVSPPMLVPKWKDEVVKWLPRDRKYSVIISSYNQLTDPETLEYYTRNHYTLTILDEAHYLKNYESVRTQAIIGAPGQKHKTILKASEKLLWLSATPMPNRVGELHPFLSSGKHKILKGQTQEDFIIKWAEKYKWLMGRLTHSGIKNPEKLMKALSEVMLRREKDDVLDELPPFNREIIPLAIPKKFLKQDLEFRDIFRKKVSLLPSLDSLNDIQTLNYLTKIPKFTEFSEFRRKQALAKVPIVLDYLKEEDSGKYVIFTYHIDVAKEYFKKLKIENKILITGEDDLEERYQTLKRADKIKNCVLVATMNAVKEGFDLTGFNRVFYTEVDWSFSLLNQTEGRFRRIGQKDFVNYFYLLFEHGLEGYIYDTYKAKERTVNLVIPVRRGRN